MLNAERPGSGTAGFTWSLGRPGSWKYAARRGRDLRVDLLRGLCITIILIDHVGGWSPLFYLTGGAKFFVTAAEGFVCISGLVFGKVYRPIVEKSGMKAVWAKALRRSGQLYLVAMASSLLLLGGGMLVHLPWARFDGLGQVASFIGGLLTFQLMFPLVRILAMYTLLVAIAPVGIWLVSRGKPWLLVALSLILYAAFQLFPDQLRGPLPTDMMFHPFAYQVLFFHALAVGYYADELGAWLTDKRQAWLVRISAVTLAFLFILYWTDGRVLGGAFSTPPDVWMERVFDRVMLRPGRLVATASVLLLLFFAVDAAWSPIERAVGWFFLPLGKKPLYCYVIHILTAMVVNRVMVWGAARGFSGPLLNASVQLSLISVIWLLVRLDFMTWIVQ
jgi:hypothetical protein